jgi:hypothetical protein
MMGLFADIEAKARLDRIEPTFRQTQPEISAIHFVRSAGNSALRRFIGAFIEAQLSTPHEGRHPS